MNDNQFFEVFYEKAVFPHYKGAFDLDDIKWFSHGKIGPDTWAHYFRSHGIEYALVYEDFPDGSYLSDGLTHEIVLMNSGDKCLELKFNDKMHVEGITGWYTLFKDKRQLGLGA
jgi:hypothetical protein